MTWKAEIIRSLFVTFGALQTLLNVNYIIKKNGFELARKQHRELPDNVTDKQIKIKTICMLSFGVLFLSSGLFSFLTRSYYEVAFIVVLGSYAVYALIEAIYYRFWRTFGAFIISAILFLVALFG